MVERHELVRAQGERGVSPALIVVEFDFEYAGGPSTAAKPLFGVRPRSCRLGIWNLPSRICLLDLSFGGKRSKIRRSGELVL